MTTWVDYLGVQPEENSGSDTPQMGSIEDAGTKYPLPYCRADCQKCRQIT